MKKKMPRWLGGTVVAAVALVGVSASGSRPAEKTLAGVPRSDIAKAYSRLPLSFEVNQGQAGAKTKFLARGNGYNVLLRPAEAEIRLRRPKSGRLLGALAEKEKGGQPERTSVKMRLIGANPNAAGRSEKKLAGVSHYLRGRNESSWLRNIPNFAQVRFDEVYPGVDVVYYGNQRQLEHDFIVRPGADPKRVKLEFDGADALWVDDEGNLAVSTPNGTLGLQKPLVYQDVEGARQHIEAEYLLADSGTVSFRIGEYDTDRPLVIDPVLLWGTFLGGSGLDQGNGIALDPENFVYVAGSTDSVNFPTTPGSYQPVKAALTDAFLCKLNEDGTELIYSTYLGGSGQDYGTDVAVDTAGRPFLCGATSSPDFPVVAPSGAEPAQPVYGGGPSDAFVSRFTADGSGLFYSTFLGGYKPPKVVASEEIAYGIAVDGPGNVFVCGTTQGTDYHVVSPIQGLYGGGPTDGFVTGLDVLGRISFSTYLGGGPANYGGNTDYGAGVDVPYGIDVDPLGYVYIAGSTSSRNFPVFNNLQAVNRSKRPTDSDGWVAKMVPSGQKFVWCTYLGGMNDDKIFDVAADEIGNAYVTGYTRSNNFPISKKEPAPFRGTPVGKDDAFVTKIDAAGFQMIYSTYLGGTGDDYGRGIAVGPNGIAYVTGYTSSDDFPVTRAMQKHFGGLYDTFVTKLDSTASHLIYSGYFGGNDQDYGNGIALDSDGDAYIVGTTLNATFPATTLSVQNKYGGGVSDAFVAKVTDEVPLVASGSIRVPRRVVFPRTPVGFVISKRFRMMNVARAPMAVKVGSMTAPCSVADGGGSYVMPGRAYQYVTLHFKPDVVGPITRTLNVECSDPRRPVCVITVTGRGYIPVVR